MPARDLSEIPPWERMRHLVAALLNPHPLLRDLPYPAEVEGDRFAIRVTSGRWGGAVERWQWYVPLTEDNARRLALELAIQIREGYDEAQ